MAHAIWRGNISFGLINIPISLTAAENHKEIHFHLYTKKEKANVGYQYYNKATGKPLKRDEIIKGYELDNGKLIEINDEVIKEIAGENLKTIEIEGFVKASSIDFMDFDTPYYLVPDKKGEKAYAVLQEALKKSNKIGIAKVMIHSSEKLAAIIPYKNALILNVLRFHNELRTPEEAGITNHIKIKEKEVKLAEQFINSMSEAWKPNTYKDEYQIALQKWLKQRAKTAKPRAKMVSKTKSRTKGNVIDFVDLLKKSMKQKKAKGH